MGKQIRYEFDVRILFALGSKPRDQIGFQASFREDVPDGFALARGCRNRNDPLIAYFRKAMHAMLRSMASRSDRRPEHRGQGWLKSSQISMNTLADDALHRRHLAPLHQRLDDLPVG
jgi:hypothetical protein